MASTAQETARSSRTRNIGAGIFVVIAVLSGLIAVSVYFTTAEPFEDAANTLIATFGVGMALLGVLIAVVPFRRGERWAWAALWVWPLFFITHVVALGSVIPDAILAAVTAAALIMTRPRAASIR